MYQRIILFILFPLFSFSQAPQKINFQSILRNTNEEVIENKSVRLKISKLTGTIGGSSVYSETHYKTIYVPSLNLVNRFKTNVNDSDTSTMLNPYLRLASGLLDIDGNNYPIIKIGNQIWMKENLRVSRYRNGDLIPNVTDNTAWGTLTSGGRSWYNNDSTNNENPYGNLYNWYAVTDSRGLCPSGWHVPSDSEWDVLTNSLGGLSVAGGKMKSVGTTYWISPNKDATNESGFSALPGGCRGNDGNFYNILGYAFFWSATEFDNANAWYRYINHNFADVYRNYNDASKAGGATVRCLKD